MFPQQQVARVFPVSAKKEGVQAWRSACNGATVKRAAAWARDLCSAHVHKSGGLVSGGSDQAGLGWSVTTFHWERAFQQTLKGIPRLKVRPCPGQATPVTDAADSGPEKWWFRGGLGGHQKWLRFWLRFLLFLAFLAFPFRAQRPL